MCKNGCACHSPGEAVRENYRRQGAEAERERIINLLFQMTCIMPGGEVAISAKWADVDALIKGEK